MDKNLLKQIRPLLIVFILFNAFFLLGKTWLIKNAVDTNVLIVGNLILFLVSLFAFISTQRALKSTNPQAFVRAMYGGFIVKFFLLAIVAFVYIMIAKKDVNKPALIFCAGLYIIYTGIETKALMKTLLKKNNG